MSRSAKENLSSWCLNDRRQLSLTLTPCLGREYWSNNMRKLLQSRDSDQTFSNLSFNKLSSSPTNVTLQPFIPSIHSYWSTIYVAVVLHIITREGNNKSQGAATGLSCCLAFSWATFPSLIFHLERRRTPFALSLRVLQNQRTPSKPSSPGSIFYNCLSPGNCGWAAHIIPLKTKLYSYGPANMTRTYAPCEREINQRATAQHHHPQQQITWNDLYNDGCLYILFTELIILQQIIFKLFDFGGLHFQVIIELRVYKEQTVLNWTSLPLQAMI